MTDTDVQAETPPPDKKAKKAKPESDAERSERRAKELQALSDDHIEKVTKAHKDYPVPPIPFHLLDDAERLRHNQKRDLIDRHNRDFNRAVNAACERHNAETAQ